MGFSITFLYTLTLTSSSVLLHGFAPPPSWSLLVLPLFPRSPAVVHGDNRHDHKQSGRKRFVSSHSFQNLPWREARARTWVRNLKAGTEAEAIGILLTGLLPMPAQSVLCIQHKTTFHGWEWWRMPFIPAPGRQRQVDLYEFEASLICIVRPCFKNPKISKWVNSFSSLSALYE